MNADAQQRMGDAWLALAAELEQQLRDSDPDAKVEAAVDPNGLLTLEVRTVSHQRASGLELAREYERRADGICEHCGAGVTVAGAGPVVTILCPRCST